MFLLTSVLGANTTPQALAVANQNALTNNSYNSEKAITILPKDFKIETPTAIIVSSPDSEKGSLLSSSTIQEKVKSFYLKTPVLISIARCESTFRQFDDAGNILRGKTNKKDIGIMQINEKYHASRAKALGLDLYTLEGNLAYAKVLYDEQGTTPWISSFDCWGRPIARAN